jgi:hypothetical protein
LVLNTGRRQHGSLIVFGFVPVALFDAPRAIGDLSSGVINAPFSSFCLTFSAPIFGRPGLHSKSFSKPRVVMFLHHAIRWF